MEMGPFRMRVQRGEVPWRIVKPSTVSARKRYDRRGLLKVGPTHVARVCIRNVWSDHYRKISIQTVNKDT